MVVEEVEWIRSNFFMPPFMTCAQCGKDMLCIKNGVVVGFNGGNAQVHADFYRCPDCGCGVIRGYAGEYMHPDQHEEIKDLDFLFS